MVSKASEDLPEPDRPVNTTSWSRGISTSTFLRLCSRAPRIAITRPRRGAARAALVEQVVHRSLRPCRKSPVWARIGKRRPRISVANITRTARSHQSPPWTPTDSRAGGWRNRARLNRRAFAPKTDTSKSMSGFSCSKRCQLFRSVLAGSSGKRLHIRWPHGRGASSRANRTCYRPGKRRSAEHQCVLLHMKQQVAAFAERLEVPQNRHPPFRRVLGQRQHLLAAAADVLRRWRLARSAIMTACGAVMLRRALGAVEGDPHQPFGRSSATSMRHPASGSRHVVQHAGRSR